jgi:site-specific DNA-methyltransferase (adenine-specific)
VSTETKAFGTGPREGHDASAFYARFPTPILCESEDVRVSEVKDPCVCDDARNLGKYLAPNSVALVVTSPPYFVGKEYEVGVGQGVVPASYAAYLTMLEEVFAACFRVMEPGGRIAVNVANLGRKPYRSLSADVIRIFERLGLLLRGEIIWRKAEGASGSCAWGSFARATNPVLRDLTERVIVASKWRFDRAITPKRRKAMGLPHVSTINPAYFMRDTLDVWNIAPERAKKIGHPAPFPVELPARLIDLYTFAGDLVLDPFMGAGTTLVAAQRAGRRAIGFDTEPAYVELARKRLGEK